jgi:hypothetical protein
MESSRGLPLAAWGTEVQLTRVLRAATLNSVPSKKLMATIDEDLTQLEKDIRQLKIEYEQFFGGGRSRPPTDIEWRIEQVIKRYGERGANMSFSQRFRYSALAQTHSRFREVFRKRLKQKEEGVVPRHYGSAAKAIEAERAARKRADPAESLESQAPGRAGVTLSDVEHDNAKTRKLYEAFIQAKEDARENPGNITPEAFQEFLRRKALELREKSGEGEIEFFVAVENGHAKLKARLSSPAKSRS